MITSKPENVGMSSKRLERINELTKGYVDRGDLAGTVTLVARRGEVVHCQSTGMLNIEKNIPMREDAIFGLFSMTKPITTVAAMILYERGFFQLDTPVSKFIPEFKNMEVFAGGTAEDYKTVKQEREMNMLDLLTHTSGITYDLLFKTPVDEMYRKKGLIINNLSKMKVEDFVQIITQTPLLFSPGTKWNYSYSSDILGHVLEIMAGTKLDELIKSSVCDPLGMQDTGFYAPEEKWDRLSPFYYFGQALPSELRDKFQGQKLANIGFEHTNKPSTLNSGGGGMVSTISDYLKLATMFLNKGRYGEKQLLSPKTIDLITTNHLPGDIRSFNANNLGSLSPQGYGYGMGMAVMLDPAKANIIGTPGEYFWTGAGHTGFFVDPKEELIAIIMTHLMPTIYKIDKQFKTAVYQSITESYIS